MSLRRTLPALALALAMAAPMAAQAHRQWMLPSSTVLSGDEAWITVDAAVSNDLFVFEHVPMRLEGLEITGPDGARVEPQNASTGKYRSTFDVQLTRPGTYRIASTGDTLVASYKLNGETKRWRGRATDLKTAIPAGAQDVKLTHAQRRVEVFATLAAPSDAALKPTGKGLELQPVTHPNDLFAGEAAKFKLLLDGQPAKDVKVTVVPGGGRYRKVSGEMEVTTDAAGTFEVTWPEAGMYWLEAEVRGGTTEVPNAIRSATYVATLEVLND